MFNTVPSFVPSLLASEKGVDLEKHWLHGYDFNGAIEVTTESLREISDEFARDCIAYWMLCSDFWDMLNNNNSSGLSCIITERDLGYWRQVDKKTERSYLSKQYDELRNTSLIDAVLVATSADIDHKDLESLPSVRSVRVEPDYLSIELEYKGRRSWSNALGGVPGRGEIARVFTIRVSQAKWRDSRVKRILDISARAIEILPEVK